MSIEDSRQRQLAASVDHVVIRIGRKIAAFADCDNAVILNDERAVANYSAARVNRDKVVDVANDEAGHGPTRLLFNFLATAESCAADPKVVSYLGELGSQVRD